MKLYILQQNGIVKIGITKHEDTKIRLSQINSTLPTDKKFELVCDFEVPDSAAMVERLIHEYLGINQLNIQYLKNEMVLVNVDYLHSKHEGYTEYFVADKDKVKQAITLFGILDYIKVSSEQLKELDNIKGHSFDFFAEKYPEFLKLCEPINRLKETNRTTDTKTLHSVMSDVGNSKVKADFFIENNQFYLLLNDSKIKIEELTLSHNSENVTHLLNNNQNLILEKKELQNLYSIIRELRANNKATSLQPLTSMQKELKEHEFYDFMENHDGYKKVKEILDPWNGDGFFANELLGEDSSYYNAIINVLSDVDYEFSSKQKLQLEKQKLSLENTKIFKPNFNSPTIFPEYISLINKEDYFLNDYDYHNSINESVNMIASIYKILYNSKDKEQELKKIEVLLDYIDEFYNRIDDPNYKSRSNKTFSQLEKSITELMGDQNYIDLAEAEIQIYGYYHNANKIEQRALKKLNTLKK